MPNKFIQHAFKMQYDTMQSKNGKDAMAGEEMMDQLEDALT